MHETIASWFIPKYANPYKVLHKPHLNIYTSLLPTTLVAHLTFHVSKLKPFNEDKKSLKDKKYPYHPRFDLIEERLTREVECILAINHTKHIGKQYLVKWK
jgi:hypothetical protein